MKKLIKFSFTLLMATLVLNSCSSDDKVIDEVFDGVTRGAVLRTIQIIDSEIAIGATDPRFTVEIEEQDPQDGALLSEVRVYTRFTDASAGTTTTESMLTTLAASDFSTDTPFGLPRYTLSISLAELLANNGITQGDIFGGDNFRVRLELELTDGRVFSDYNAGGIITGGFFASPFAYNVPVVCSVPSDYFMGQYSMIRTSTVEDPFFPTYGQAFSSTTAQTVTLMGTGATRTFNFSYFPTGFDFGMVMTLNLSCGNILVSSASQAGTLGCGGGTIQQSTGPVPSTYNLADDSVFDIDFLDFEPDAGCGTGNYPVTIRLTKL